MRTPYVGIRDAGDEPTTYPASISSNASGVAVPAAGMTGIANPESPHPPRPVEMPVEARDPDRKGSEVCTHLGRGPVSYRNEHMWDTELGGNPEQVPLVSASYPRIGGNPGGGDRH
jgi:hypothetical protein